MGLIEDNSKFIFKKTLFLWLPIAAIIMIIKKWSKDKNKDKEEKEGQY